MMTKDEGDETLKTLRFSSSVFDFDFQKNPIQFVLLSSDE
jgi:hypothetical protein